jgi:hypothetical protein
MTAITITPSARMKRAVARLAADCLAIKIDGATADEQLAQRVEAIRDLGKRTIANVIEIGHHLAEAKKLCGHGNWLPWLKREFGWSDKTAEQFMNVYQLGKIENISNLSLPVSGLYRLARPSTPEAVRQEVIERVQHGEKVSVAVVEGIIAKAKAIPAVPDKPKAKPPTPAPYVYAPDDIIDQIVVLFSQLAHRDQHRCVLKLRAMLRGL